MKSLLTIAHTIEVNHVKYYQWRLNVVSNRFGGIFVGGKQFDNPHNAIRSARRVAKRLNIDITKTAIIGHTIPKAS